MKINRENMKVKLTIGEMAKLKNVTVETLRHYDKIDLFKPYYTDPNTGYRYYSITQYEVLGTIIELRRIGLSIEEIKVFLNNRNLNQSVTLLEDTLNRIKQEIAELQYFEKLIESRLNNVQRVLREYDQEPFVIKTLPERAYIVLEKDIKWSEMEELYFGFLELESAIEETVPIFASNRYGEFIKKEYLEEFQTSDQFNGTLSDYGSKPFILVQNAIPKRPTKVLEAGIYACAYYGGLTHDKMVERIFELLKFCKKHHYKIIGDAVRVIQIDISLTDNMEEALYEIQIPVEKIEVK